MPDERRLIQAQERFVGRLITLRLVTLEDCTEEYVGWLNDSEVNRYLETRWEPQTATSVRNFVSEQLRSSGSYLFAILENPSERHVGNIRLGPIDPRHLFADVSYFVGDRSVWGRGYSTEAIRLVVALGFTRLGLHRMQAGVYANNRASRRALEKAGLLFEGIWRSQLRGPDGWEDHCFYGALREDWERKA